MTDPIEANSETDSLKQSSSPTKSGSTSSWETKCDKCWIWMIGIHLSTNPYREEWLVRLCYFWYGLCGSIPLVFGVLVWTIIQLGFDFYILWDDDYNHPS